RLAVGLAEIVKETVEFRIDRFVDRGWQRAAVQRRRRGNGHLRRAAGIGFDELEMLDHGMAGEADLAGDLDAVVARGHAGKGDTGLHCIAFDAVEAPEKIEMPPRAAEFAVGDRLQPDAFLFFDGVLDLAVLNRFELIGADFAFGAPLARRLDRRRPQQAADMIGAKRRLGALGHWFCSPYSPLPVMVEGSYPHTSSAISTMSRSFAHCSSSARILPSSVEAKPHCGDRQS